VEARITGTLQRAIDEDLPLIIGEFAHVGPTKTCDLPFPYQHLINEADRLSFSWLAWSWGPGNSDCKDMDMTPTDTFAGLDDWGLEVAVSHPNSIKNTSQRPSIILNASAP
jgi:mannan endo-1,4-beta-mannosidase